MQDNFLDMEILCPLCEGTTDTLYSEIADRKYYKCPLCDGVFMGSDFLPNRTEEIDRYMEHNNDVYDERYRNFVNPIVDAILRDFPKNSKGLDFGAGTGPVISQILREQGYEIVQYDPFFHPYESLFNQEYDYIVACEVIEHFHYPASEFSMLRDSLKANGKLYCKTSVLQPDQNFESWYYKDDPTHVFFYSFKTLERIKKVFDFKKLIVKENLIIFSI